MGKKQKKSNQKYHIKKNPYIIQHPIQLINISVDIMDIHIKYTPHISISKWRILLASD